MGKAPEGKKAGDALRREERARRGLYLKGLATGITAGFVVVAYRLILEKAAVFRTLVYGQAARNGPAGVFLLFAGLAAAALLVGSLVRRAPMIKGSGIPQVKGVLLRQFRMKWLEELVLKFFGGVTALAFGLSLGREGPSIQLGAHVGAGLASASKSPEVDGKYLITAGAGAGLAAAFNAPLAGVLFSLEELHKSFSPLMLTCTMVASLAAEIVSRNFVGLSPVFDFTLKEYLPLRHYPVLVFLGALCGLVGVVFNAALIRSLDLHDSLIKSDILKPLPAFLTAGCLGFLLPEVLGGGHELLMDSALGKYGVTLLILILGTKLFFTALSYGSGSPGGIFFPLLVVGALLGRIFSDLLVLWFSFDPGFAVNFVILGMAAFFTAVTRAPITGAVLISEMTGSLSHLISLIIVSAVAYAVAEALKAKPIYDAFLDRLLSKGTISRATYEEGGKKMVLTIPVCSGSFLEQRPIRDLILPPGCVLVGVVRGKLERLPRPDMVLLPGDLLSVLTEEQRAAELKPALLRLGLPGPG